MTTLAFKGVAFDVDGTLLTSSNVVSQRMRQACQTLVENGVWLTLASARPPKSVLLIADEIGAPGPFCALNGAIIIARNGTILSRLSLPRALGATLIARFVNDPRVSLNVYSGADWLVPRLDSRIQEEAGIIGFGPDVRSDLSDVGDIEKILLMADEVVAAKLVFALAAESDKITVARSKPDYVEITPHGVDKKQGIESASRSAGLTLDAIVACGDGENDITLLDGAGYGIALAHAPAELRAVATQVVADDDSLAAALVTLFTH